MRTDVLDAKLPLIIPSQFFTSCSLLPSADVYLIGPQQDRPANGKTVSASLPISVSALDTYSEVPSAREAFAVVLAWYTGALLALPYRKG